MARGRVWLLSLAAALVVWGLLVWRFDFTCDDAYIAFRYARHLAEGHGLRFNLGESPAVEGYSNLLWVLWLALFQRFGADPAIVANFSSIACGAALIALATRAAVRRCELELPAALAVALFLACLPPMSVWATSGLEAMPFALAVFATWERLAGDPDRPRGAQAGACALAAALLRADGALWAGFAIAAAAFELRGRVRGWLRALAVPLAILALGEAGHLLWRHGYHGEWLPNTARVKAGLSSMRLERGFKYVASFGLEVLPFLLVPLLAVRAASRLALSCGIVLVLAIGYSVFVGGDFMPMGRFLLPGMPFLAILLARIASDPRGLALAFGCAGLALLPSFDLHPVPLSVRERFHFRWNQDELESEVAMWRGMRDRADQWKDLGRALASNTSPGESIVLGNIGAVGFLTELEIFDLFGLVDPEVARRDAPLVRASPGHDKRVGFEFFLPRHPTYLSAWIAPAQSPPEDALPPEWLALLRSGRVELVRRPLLAKEGAELRLLRFRRTD